MNAAEAIQYLKSKPRGMPVFPLLASDPDAPKTVRDWAARYSRRPNADGHKVEGAMQVAYDMEDWKTDHRFDDGGWSIMPMLQSWPSGYICGSVLTVIAFVIVLP